MIPVGIGRGACAEVPDPFPRAPFKEINTMLYQPAGLSSTPSPWFDKPSEYAMTSSRERTSAEAEGYRIERSLMDSWLLRGVCLDFRPAAKLGVVVRHVRQVELVHKQGGVLHPLHNL